MNVTARPYHTPNKRLERTRHQRASLLSCVGEPLKRNAILLLLEAAMRVLILAAIAVLATTLTYSQTSKQNNVAERPDLAYPTAGYLLPEIPLLRALKIAKAFIKRDRIEISSCHFIEAKWMKPKPRMAAGVSCGLTQTRRPGTLSSPCRLMVKRIGFI